MILRAVIYARCSTEEESQKDALKKQVEEGKICVREKGWILKDIYVESRSGTTTKGRSEYNRLYNDLQRDRFDIIVIKSQDRLMRNTKDWYLFVDRLLTGQKKLYIYIERKFYTTDDALITGIKAILAEEYSRELSKKINNAHKNRQKQGGPVVLTSNTYGYRKLPDKSVVIVEDEAKVKRRMYELCAAGFGSRSISAILKNEGIVGRNGKPFTDSAILRMIHNPLNKGTAVMNRLHYDFESKRTMRVPREEQYVHENKVPPIVSEELWEAANEEIAKRAETAGLAGERKRGRNPGKSPLSGKLVCGLCGSPYYRRTRRRYKDKDIIYEWKCKRYLEIGRNEGKADRPQLKQVRCLEVNGCDNVHLEEMKLYGLLEQVCNQRYRTDKAKIIGYMVDLLKVVLKEEDCQLEFDREIQKKEKLLKQMDMLVEKLLDEIISNEVYQRKQKRLEEQLSGVQNRINELERQEAKGSVLQERFSYIEKELRTGKAVERAAVMQMLEETDKILVFPEFMEIVFGLSEAMRTECWDIPPMEFESSIKIEYGNLFSYREQKKEEREIIVDMMRENPRITAGMIAKELRISLSGANYRIRALKKEGRIRFNGSGGKGEWEIL